MNNVFKLNVFHTNKLHEAEIFKLKKKYTNREAGKVILIFVYQCLWTSVGYYTTLYSNEKYFVFQLCPFQSSFKK